MLATGTTSAVQKERLSPEEEVFRLKLAWMMAKSDEERRRLSQDIRRKLGQPVSEK